MPLISYKTLGVYYLQTRLMRHGRDTRIYGETYVYM